VPKNIIAVIWATGALAALAAYLVGPEHLLNTLAALSDQVTVAVAMSLRDLSASAVNVVHALAVGLFVTFVGLALVAIRSGRKGRAALVVVSAVFVWLVWSGDAPSNQRWLAAFVLAGLGTLVMSSRLHGGERM